MRDHNEQPRDGIPGTDAWKPWRPDEVMERLAGVGAPWCVAGGWALDLWHGQETRPHEDLEIAILRPDFAVFRAQLSGFRCCVADSGKVSALPTDSAPGSDKHQIWVLDEPAKAWRMDILLEPGDGQMWVFRRDQAIRRPRSQMIATTAGGVRYLKPEAVLLYKAKAVRAKDEKDLSLCVPLMEAAARAWLKVSLVRVYPCHPWIGRLK
jgi:hypothetical protein